MKLYSYAFYFLIICSLGFSSCDGGEDDDEGGCNTNWEAGVQDEANALSDAKATFSSDQSAENSEALINAYQNYINALKPYGDCELLVGDDLTAFQNELEEVEDELANPTSVNFDFDKVNCGDDWQVVYQNELTAYYSAVLAYSADPSTANCNVYKSAYLNFINAYIPLIYCQYNGIYDQAYIHLLINESLKELQDDVSDLCGN